MRRLHHVGHGHDGDSQRPRRAGIDRISITENSATTHGYPIYDGHGNCRAILTKNGSRSS